jgi:hypothetical protein
LEDMEAMTTFYQKFRAVFEDGGTEYTYLWAGDGDLKVGDRVETPVPYWATGQQREASVATVVALESTYRGSLTVVRRRA